MDRTRDTWRGSLFMEEGRKRAYKSPDNNDHLSSLTLTTIEMLLARVTLKVKEIKEDGKNRIGEEVWLATSIDHYTKNVLNRTLKRIVL